MKGLLNWWVMKPYQMVKRTRRSFRKYILKILARKLPLAAAKLPSYHLEIEHWANWDTEAPQNSFSPPQSAIQLRDPPTAAWAYSFQSLCIQPLLKVLQRLSKWLAQYNDVLALVVLSLEFILIFYRRISLSLPSPFSLLLSLSLQWSLVHCYEILEGLSLKMSCLPLAKPGSSNSHSMNFRSWV